MQVIEWNGFAIHKIHSHAPSSCTCACTCTCGHLHTISSTVQPAICFEKLEAAHMPAAQKFLSRDVHFDTLPAVAATCRIILLKNLSVRQRLVNGSVARVHSIHIDDSGQPQKIIASFHPDEEPVAILRCSTKTEILGGGHIHTKRTFPLALGHAISGHKSQGATVRNDAILDIASAFTQGLVYTMITRVTQRKHLFIIGKLTPAMLKPTPFARWLSPAGLAAYRCMP